MTDSQAAAKYPAKQEFKERRNKMAKRMVKASKRLKSSKKLEPQKSLTLRRPASIELDSYSFGASNPAD